MRNILSGHYVKSEVIVLDRGIPPEEKYQGANQSTTNSNNERKLDYSHFKVILWRKYFIKLISHSSCTKC